MPRPASQTASPAADPGFASSAEMVAALEPDSSATACAGSIRAGDWVEFGLIGVYSLSNRSAFNGIYPDRFVRIDADSLPPGLSGA